MGMAVSKPVILKSNERKLIVIWNECAIQEKETVLYLYAVASRKCVLFFVMYTSTLYAYIYTNILCKLKEETNVHMTPLLLCMQQI